MAFVGRAIRERMRSDALEARHGRALVRLRELEREFSAAGVAARERAFPVLSADNARAAIDLQERTITEARRASGEFLSLLAEVQRGGRT